MAALSRNAYCPSWQLLKSVHSPPHFSIAFRGLKQLAPRVSIVAAAAQVDVSTQDATTPSQQEQQMLGTRAPAKGRPRTGRASGLRRRSNSNAETNGGASTPSKPMTKPRQKTVRFLMQCILACNSMQVLVTKILLHGTTFIKF